MREVMKVVMRELASLAYNRASANSLRGSRPQRTRPPSIYLSVLQPVRLSKHLSIRLSVCPSVSLFVSPTIYLSIRPSVRLSVSVHSSIRLSVLLSNAPSVKEPVDCSSHSVGGGAGSESRGRGVLWQPNPLRQFKKKCLYNGNTRNWFQQPPLPLKNNF